MAAVAKQDEEGEERRGAVAPSNNEALKEKTKGSHWLRGMKNEGEGKGRWKIGLVKNISLWTHIATRYNLCYEHLWPILPCKPSQQMLPP